MVVSARKSLLILAVLMSCLISTGAELSIALTSAQKITSLSIGDYATLRPFCVTGLVTCAGGRTTLIECADGALQLWSTNLTAKAGQVIRAAGRTELNAFANDPILHMTNSTVIGTGTIPEPRRLSVSEFLRGDDNNRVIRIRGFLSSILKDEVDSKWFYGILNADGDMFHIAIPSHGRSLAQLKGLIDAELELTGICSPFGHGKRKFLGPHLGVLGNPESIRVITPPPKDPFSAPLLEELGRINPKRVFGMRRRKVEGRILARWEKDLLLLREANGRIVKIQLDDSETDLRSGEDAEAVGLPETDLYNINLSRAIIRRTTGPASAAERDELHDTSPNDIFHETETGGINADFHGRAIRLHGSVRTVPDTGTTPLRIGLECDGHIVPVDVTANPAALAGLAIDSVIEARGICILETDNWSPNRIFPTIRGFILVPRTTDDIRIVSNPPWWTPQRFAIAIGLFLSILVTILIWNASLRILVERRSRQLIKSQAEKLESDLRIDERTRIASELHDYLAQNLTATSYQLTAAKFAKDQDPAASAQHLETACTMLNSSRTELRRCLWDLRSDALEEPTFEKAIRRTLQQILNEDTALSLDLGLSRSAVSDTTAHTILSIIRELVANAILHGRAKSVWISGEIRNETLCIGVRDDGCGFDTSTRKDSEAGHFGLDGIRNRIERSGGRFEIRSTPGRGTEAAIELPTSKQTGS